MKKFLFFCGLAVFMTVLLTMPAAAMCDECVNSGDQITEDHCEARCTCEYEECWACGDYSNLVYCDNEHEPDKTYSRPSCSGNMQCYSATCKHCGEKFSYCVHPKSHNYVSFSTSATCISQGESGQKCSSCGAKRNVTTSPALGHDYTTTIVQSTCDTAGYSYHECSRCDDYYTSAPIPAKGHTWVETNRQNATCTEDGFVEYACNCGETSSDTLIKSGHNYTTAVTPPTCTAEGFTVYTCSNCGDSYKSHYTDMIDHDYVDGVCSQCDKEDPNYVPPHQHSHSSSVTAPTCTAEGYTTYTCTCGDTYKGNYTDATGHNYQGGECSECGAADPDYDSSCDHSYTTTVTPPTCTAQGYTTYECRYCDDSYISNYTAKASHNYVNGKCSVCNAVDPGYTPPHTHNYSSAVTPPTCTAEGFTVYTCACGHSYKSHYTEVIPHNYVDGLCSMCDKVDPSLNPPHGHTYAAVVTAPTCHSKGFTTYTCSCGNTYVDNYVDEIPHQFVQQEKVEPKCGVEGHIYSVCNYNCGEEKYEPIPALEHAWTLIGTEFFEDNTGIATYKCSKCKETKTETIYTQSSQAENWLLTAIRGFADAFIDIYQTVANGFQIGGITLGQVISGALIVVVLLLLMAFALKILG